jgi:hypothetical protein
MTRDPDRSATVVQSLRIGDRERSDAAARLSAHAAAGRLSMDELELRLERSSAAVFGDELAAIEADLPAEGRASGLVAQAWRPGRHVSWPARPWLLAVALASVLAAVVATATVGHPIFPPIVAALLLWRVGFLPVRRSQA